MEFSALWARGAKELGVGGFFHWCWIAVLCNNSVSLTLSLLCFDDCYMKCIQPEISSVFWSNVSALYLMSVTPFNIQDSIRLVRLRHTTFFSVPLCYTRFVTIPKLKVCPVGWEFTDCTSAEGQDPHPPNEYPGYHTEQSDGEVPVMLGLWGIRSTLHCHSTQEHSGPAW